MPLGYLQGGYRTGVGDKTGVGNLTFEPASSIRLVGCPRGSPSGFGVWGLGLGFEVWGLGFRVEGLGFRV